MKPSSIILIIGMARSGTTFTLNLLGHSKQVKVLVEPHILWRTGNFNSIYDDKFDVKDRSINFIRNRMFDYAKGKILVEKSPINCLRAELVHATFPEAKVVYLNRERIKCIKSNVRRSSNKDSFKLSIILKKYFLKYKDEDLEYSSNSMSFLKQLHFLDLPNFIYFVTKSLYLRNFTKTFPFGPKISGFQKLVKDKGIEGYHNEVYKRSQINKAFLKKNYGTNFMEFNLENLQTNKKEIEKLFTFCELNHNPSFVSKLYSSIDRKRINKYNW